MNGHVHFLARNPFQKILFDVDFRLISSSKVAINTSENIVIVHQHAFVLALTIFGPILQFLCNSQ